MESVQDANPDEPGVSVRALTRRKVLRGVGAGALGVAVAGTGALSYRAYDTKALGGDGGAAYEAWRQWRDDEGPRGVVAAAVLAASPHNTQPWTFHLDGDRIEVHADPARQMRNVDPFGRELRIGLGCAVENMVLAARARGFDPRVALQPDPAQPLLAARIELPTGPRNVSALYEAIGHRHSNRGPYQDKPVLPGVLADLAALAEDPVPAVTWITARADRDALGTLMIDAAQAVVDDEEQSRDGFAWFRSSAGAIDAHRDGLTLDGQGLNPLMTVVAKLLPASSRQSGDAFWLDQTRTVHTRTAAAYGLVLVPDPRDPVRQLQGGRLLQRIHLAVTARGLALQHMNQITERIDRDVSQGRDPVLASRLAAFVREPGVQVLSAFRIGHPERQARLSPRRLPSEVLR